MDQNTSDTDSDGQSELMDISDSECVTQEELQEIALGCRQRGINFVGEHAILGGPDQVNLKPSKKGRISYVSETPQKLALSAKPFGTDAEIEKTDLDQVELSEMKQNQSVSLDKSGIGVQQSTINSEFADSERTNRDHISVRKVNQMKRMRGEEYVGFSEVRNPVKHKRRTPQNKLRMARKMGGACESKECKKSRKRHCEEFTEEIRTNLFHDFWKLLNWGEKQAFVQSLVDKTIPKRCKLKTGPIRKQETFLYYLKLNGVRKQVCRQMFLHTLGIGRKQLHSWLTRKEKEEKGKGEKEETQSETSRNRKGGDVQFAESFLLELPKLPSHYCRKDTSKLYLEPMFRNSTHLYNVYVEKCKEEEIKFVAFSTFSNLLDKNKIAIHQPKKDRCDTCCSWEAKNIDEEIYQEHIIKKDSARAEKVKDKHDAIQGSCHVVTMDVQKVLLSPVLNASALYYKTKLIVHNFTVFDLATSQATCYLWDETEADLVGSVFATCLLTFLENNFQDDLPIIIFSDGCTSQNRNAVMSNALIHYAVRNKKVVIQKYLEKGHTQMEVDSVHARIETKLKGQSIYLPSDYIDICRSSKKQDGGYSAISMKFSDFVDYSVNKSYKSIRPGTKKTDPHVTHMRQIKYNPDGTLEYKLEHQQPFIPFPRRNRVDPKGTFPKLYTSQLPIAKRKFDDLQELLHVLPERCHKFYKSLPHKNN